MKPYLLDVNLLIALSWPAHVHHDDAQSWFARHRQDGFRTCPLTEAGFLRISTNPSFTPDAVSPGEALMLVDRMAAMPEHGFWPDDLPLRQALGKAEGILGHRQITDAYLVALARKHKGILATLDRALLALPGATGAVEIVVSGS